MTVTSRAINSMNNMSVCVCGSVCVHACACVYVCACVVCRSTGSWGFKEWDKTFVYYSVTFVHIVKLRSSAARDIIAHCAFE